MTGTQLEFDLGELTATPHPNTKAARVLVQVLERAGVLEPVHAPLVSDFYTLAAGLDNAKALYVIPALSQQFRELYADLHSLLGEEEGAETEFDVVLLHPVAADAG